jgi:hypothetical protein
MENAMNLSGGTQQARDWINARQAEGRLVDVYSQEWFNKQDPDGPFPPSLLGKMETELGSDFLHHLLVVWLDGCRQDARNELVAIYPPLSKLIGTNGHEPDFLFINLRTQQILCVGLGRKNRMFGIDAATYDSIAMFGLLRNGDVNYMPQFTELDHAKIIWHIVSSLFQVGCALDDFMKLPGNPDTVLAAMAMKPAADGLRYIEGEDDGYTLKELKQFAAEHKDSDDQCKEAMEIINLFFSNCDDGDFNTGDY